ncbi:MAG: hypothetical protein JXR77_19705 [Lentisphaeria bacterium]|nr:hypothetical protein [Lentisphaeria bacterium]
MHDQPRAAQLLLTALAATVWGAAAAAAPLAPCLTGDTLDSERSYAVPGRTPPSPRVLRIGGVANHAQGWDTARVGEPGTAHMVLCFRAPLRVGTVLLYGGWEVAYLRADGDPGAPEGEQWAPVPYPGDPARLLRAVPLPPGVETLAVRLSAPLLAAEDGTFARRLEFATLFAPRLANVAPLAGVTVRSSGPKDQGFRPDTRRNDPACLLDGTVAARNWSSAPRDDLSPEHPEWVMLSWPAPRSVRACALFVGGSGFSEMRVEAASLHEGGGGEVRAWKTVALLDGRRPWRPFLWEVAEDFGREVTADAIRFVGTAGMTKERAEGGEGAAPDRITLGEVMVFEELGDRPAPASLRPETPVEGVVPIRFEMAEAGKASIQVLDADGKVVANVAAGGTFPAGPNTVQWDLGTLAEYWPPYPVRPHGNPDPAPGEPRLAAPGHYRWRGLRHPGLSLEYLYSYYPLKEHGLAWITADTTGGWLGDHSPPQTVVRAGGRMWVGAFCEAGHALLESDLDMRKLWGSNRIWLACPRVLAVDGGSLFYVDQGGWVGSHLAMIQLDLSSRRSRRILRHAIPDRKKDPAAADREPWDVQGLLVQGTTALLANRAADRILVLDLSANLAGPWRGFGWNEVAQTFDSERLAVTRELALPSPGRIRRFDARHAAVTTADAVLLVDLETWETRPFVTGLVHPLGLAVDQAGNVYVGEMDPSHRVRVFRPDGTPLRTVGKPGRHRVGPFDPDNLESPAGLEVDAAGNLWICESSHDVKRTSVFDAQGHCLHQVLGPTQYGGGGDIDPADADHLFYQGHEFRRDPATGTVRLANLMWRSDDDSYDRFFDGAPHNFGGWAPAYPFRRDGRLYFSSWQGWSAGAANTLWVYDGDRVRPVAAVGLTPDWLRQRLGRPAPDPHFGHCLARRVDPRVDFTWPGPPQAAIPADGFAVRWSGVLLAPREGTYRFFTASDDGVRLRVGQATVIDNWTDHGTTEDSGAVSLAAGGHPILLEFYERSGGARIRLEWEPPGLPREVPGPDSLRTSRADGAGAGLEATFWVAGSSDTLFAWTDRNDDGRVQPDEAEVGGVTLDGKPWDKAGACWQFRLNHAFETAISDGGYGQSGVAFFRVRERTERGYPVYALPTEFHVVPGLTHHADAVFSDREGNAISCDEYLYSMRPDGHLNWRYVNRWPGLHAGHNTTARGDEPGVLIAPTRFFGSVLLNEAVGEILCLNSNLGATHLLTADGLYVDRVFQDCRIGLSWHMNTPPGPELLDRISIGDEHFGGTFQKTVDAEGRTHVRYVVGQPHCSVVEVHGLDRIERLRGGDIEVTPGHLAAAEALRTRRALRAAEPKRGTIHRLRGVRVDADPGEWPAERLDGFALGYDGENLFVFVEATDDRAPFRNAATEDGFLEMFKTGDVIDVMLGTDPAAPAARTEAARGDIRLSFAPLDGEPVAVLYDYVIPGTPEAERLAFSSPWRTVYVDRVRVLRDARVAVRREGATVRLEAAVPLASLHLDPRPGLTLRGDVGRVLSDQTGTRAAGRVYWSNRATNILSDVPSEVMLQPRLWGTLMFE